MEEKKVRKSRKRALNPFRITLDATSGFGKRAMYCISVSREDDSYIVRYKDSKGTSCTAEFPTADWVLRGEESITSGEPSHGASLTPLRPSSEVSPPKARPRGPTEYNVWDKGNWTPPEKPISGKAHVEANFATQQGERAMSIARHRSEVTQVREVTGVDGRTAGLIQWGPPDQ